MNATAALRSNAVPAPPLDVAALPALEMAAAGLARLDTALDSHPLAPAWLYRARLDAVRREAAIDGALIDPWHLAAIIEGVRFRMTGDTPIDRGMTFAAARHAFDLYDWRVHPNDTRQQEIARAAGYLRETAAAHPAIVGAAFGVHAWLNAGGGRAPLRAALSRYWVDRGVTRVAVPFSAAAALAAEAPWRPAAWTGEFLAALAGEATDGLHLLRTLERDWVAARHAVKSRRRGSYAAAAVDVLAAGPLVSATSLAAALDVAPKNAARLLEGFTVLGIAVEVTHRAKRRLYGLKHLVPLREAAAPPRHTPVIGRGRGRPSGDRGGTGDGAPGAIEPSPLNPPPPLSRLERAAFDFDELDRWVAAADQAIRRAQRTLEVYAVRQMVSTSCPMAKRVAT